MVFETSTSHEAKEDTFNKGLDEKPAQITRPETNQIKAVVKTFEDFLQEKEGVGNFSRKKRDRQVKSPGAESIKGEVQKQGFITSDGSKAPWNKTSDPKAVTKPLVNSHRVTENGGDYNCNSSVADNYQAPSIGNLGLRKEKEWKRTLACKLFEERRSDNADGDGDEGMDLLWETHEIESNKAQLKTSSKKGSDDYNGIGEYEYEEELVGQLCCLHALKLSAVKMSLGMGRSNMVKISKALKGFGWLNHVSNWHGKKRCTH
ncbi:hypothetical protein V6N13_079872 [Hibiscus sabdariffa]|uniref:Uncharacterized protein n=1 Tax=Hibiscus sabdariffa TaxID=183260 RepID=A0ABR2RSW1_9ROSI